MKLLVNEDRTWRTALRASYRAWDRSTALFAKERFDPAVEADLRAKWFKVLDGYEAYLRGKSA